MASITNWSGTTWPVVITIWALAERILGGLDVARFYDMASGPNNWLPEILAVSLGGTLGYRSFKAYNERLEKKDKLERNISPEP